MNIILYKSDTCPQCKVIKMKLDQKGLTYTEEKDTEVMASRGVRSIPQLEVDGVRYTTVKAAADWIRAQEATNNG